MKPAPEARKASVPLPFFQRVCVLLDSLKPDSSANYRCVSSGDKSLYLLRLTPAFNHLLSDFFLITYWRIAPALLQALRLPQALPFLARLNGQAQTPG